MEYDTHRYMYMCLVLMRWPDSDDNIICYFLQDGDTSIHLASRHDHVQVVKKLISLGADVNVVNKVSVNY